MFFLKCEPGYENGADWSTGKVHTLFGVGGFKKIGVHRIWHHYNMSGAVLQLAPSRPPCIYVWCLVWPIVVTVPNWSLYTSPCSNHQVGSMLKTPRVPVWLTYLNGRYSMLFCTNVKLTSDWRAENRFLLHYYNGQSDQLKEAVLTIGKWGSCHTVRFTGKQFQAISKKVKEFTFEYSHTLFEDRKTMFTLVLLNWYCTIMHCGNGLSPKLPW